jgi:hypothetical protein
VAGITGCFFYCYPIQKWYIKANFVSRTIIYTLKKREYDRTFLEVLSSGKIQNPQEGSAKKGFCKKLPKLFKILYQKRVQSYTIGISFNFLLNSLLPCNNRFCLPSEVLSSHIIPLYYQMTNPSIASSSIATNLNIKREVFIISFQRFNSLLTWH